MKKIIFVFLFVYNLSSSQNNVLPFQNGEKCTYRINYGIINAGYGELSVFNNKDSYQFIGEGRSNLFFDWIFYVRDRYESLVNKKTLLPFYFNRKVNEGGHIINQEYFLNHDLNLVTSNGKEYPMKKNSQDMISAFFYARTLETDFIKETDSFYINLFLDEENYKMKVNYLGTESIKTVFGEVTCMKLSSVVQVGRVFSDKNDVTLWISEDSNHLLMRAELKILVGSIKAEIISAENIKSPLSIND